MADIVQLEENGTVLYPKTHTSAIDGLDETVVKKSGDEEITGVKNFKNGIQVNGKLLLDTFYPVGVIFQSLVATDPGTIMGGTWERITGRVLLGVDEKNTKFSTSGKNGGSETHIHDLGSGTAFTQMKITTSNIATKNIDSGPDWAFNTQNSSAISFASGTGMKTGGVNVAGSTDEVSNLQPYTTVYMWKRTA